MYYISCYPHWCLDVFPKVYILDSSWKTIGGQMRQYQTFFLIAIMDQPMKDLNYIKQDPLWHQYMKDYTIY